MKYSRYTDTEIKELLKSLVVLIDTREQRVDHIIKYLTDKKIEHKTMKLDHGDYTCMIPINKELGIHRPLYFNDCISIERKANLEELSNNFTKDRTRIENEFIRTKGKLILLIEGATYSDIIHHRYKTEYKPLSFIATLRSFQARYNLNIEFTESSLTGNSIYYSLYYHVREVLKNGQLGQAM